MYPTNTVFAIATMEMTRSTFDKEHGRASLFETGNYDLCVFAGLIGHLDHLDLNLYRIRQLFGKAKGDEIQGLIERAKGMGSEYWKRIAAAHRETYKGVPEHGLRGIMDGGTNPFLGWQDQYGGNVFHLPGCEGKAVGYQSQLSSSYRSAIRCAFQRLRGDVLRLLQRSLDRKGGDLLPNEPPPSGKFVSTLPGQLFCPYGELVEEFLSRNNAFLATNW